MPEVHEKGQCIQVAPMARMEVIVENISDTLVEFKKDQRELLNVLSTLAGQSQRITTTERDIKDVKTRLHSLETEPHKSAINLKNGALLVLGTGLCNLVIRFFFH